MNNHEFVPSTTGECLSCGLLEYGGIHQPPQTIGLDEIMKKVIANPPKDGEDERAYNKRMSSMSDLPRRPGDLEEQDRLANALPAAAPYITIFADEDGVIWARDMVEGAESERFDTVGLDPQAQDINIVMAVTQVLVKSRVGW